MNTDMRLMIEILPDTMNQTPRTYASKYSRYRVMQALSHQQYLYIRACANITYSDAEVTCACMLTCTYACRHVYVYVYVRVYVYVYVHIERYVD